MWEAYYFLENEKLQDSMGDELERIREKKNQNSHESMKRKEIEGEVDPSYQKEAQGEQPIESTERKLFDSSSVSVSPTLAPSKLVDEEKWKQGGGVHSTRQERPAGSICSKCASVSKELHKVNTREKYLKKKISVKMGTIAKLRKMLEEAENRERGLTSRVLSAESELKVSEERAREAEAKLAETDVRAQKAEASLVEMESKWTESDTRAKKAEAKLAEADEMAHNAKMQVLEIDVRAQKSEVKACKFEVKLEEAEVETKKVKAELAMAEMRAHKLEKELMEALGRAWSAEVEVEIDTGLKGISEKGSKSKG